MIDPNYDYAELLEKLKRDRCGQMVEVETLRAEIGIIKNRLEENTNLLDSAKKRVHQTTVLICLIISAIDLQRREDFRTARSK